jgi:GNAT superfamily N-acetyltransferase
LCHRPGAAHGRYYIDVAVRREQRGHGLGTLLYDDAYTFALANDVRRLEADLYDGCPPCLQFAKAYGATSIRTHNDSENEPMLAINRKLGYQPQVGEFRLLDKLPAPTR